MAAPFMELPRLVIGAVPKEGEAQTWYRTTGRLRPDEIADYYSGLNDGSATIVVLKNGNSFMIEMPIDEFDRILSSYYSFINNHPDFKEAIYNEANKRDYFKFKEIASSMRR